MRIAKEFRWEMGHRLTFHDGKCKNLHGHSYKMLVEFEGLLNADGMMIDYYDVKEIIAPIVERLDHAYMVYEEDKELIAALDKLKSNYVLVPYHPTAENLCFYFLNGIKAQKLPVTVRSIKVRIYETENTYAEESVKL